MNKTRLIVASLVQFYKWMVFFGSFQSVL